MSSEGSTGDVVVLARGRVSSPTIAYDDAAITAPPQVHDDRLPSRIGRYVVLDIVGIGGMGVVCTAYDPKLDRKVALKLLRQRDNDDPGRTRVAQLRLQREARSLAKLKHPNVVAVHDVDIVDGRLYIAMEYVEGESVDEWFEHTTRSWREIVEVFIQAAKGLVAAHAAGITHRDFKPANVRLEPSGRVVVLDFGLALAQGGGNTGDGVGEPDEESGEVADQESGEVEGQESAEVEGQESAVPQVAEKNRRLTAVGRRVGTPAYMAPEQILGHSVGPATDQFAFGASLYEALYGVLPFRGDANTAMWSAVEGDVAPPPKDRVVPPWLHRVVARLLHRDPQGRFADMHAVIAALSAGLHRRRRGRIAAATLGGMIAVGGLVWTYAFDTACPGAAARVDARWNADRRDSLARDFAATGVPFAEHAASRSAAVLDERATAWKRAHVEICEATRVRGEQSDALLDHRMACLDAALLELGALVDVFAETDAKLVEHAVVATMELTDPQSCQDERPDDADAKPDPGEAEMVASVREQIARTRALIVAMRVEPAYAGAQAVWESAAKVGHAPTRVAARQLWADALILRRDFDSAETELAALIRDAATHRLFVAESAGWTQHLQLVGHAKQDAVRALGERLSAEAAVARAGSRPSQVASLAHALGVTLSAASEFAAAADQFEVAIRHRQDEASLDHPGTAAARNDLGIALIRLQRHREAEDEFRAALEAYKSSLGPTHPKVASTSLNLGNAVAEGREGWAECAQLYADALQIREAVFGPTDPMVAEVLVAQGSLARRVGDHRKAIDVLQRAVALFGGDGATDLRAGMALNNLGTSHAALEEFSPAIDAFTRAIALFDRQGAPQHPSRMRAYLRRCRARADARDFALAKADCDVAAGLLAAVETPNPNDLNDLDGARALLDNERAGRTRPSPAGRP